MEGNESREEEKEGRRKKKHFNLIIELERQMSTDSSNRVRVLVPSDGPIQTEKNGIIKSTNTDVHQNPIKRLSWNPAPCSIGIKPSVLFVNPFVNPVPAMHAVIVCPR